MPISKIEKARFQSRLQVSLFIPDELASQHLPAFTLQPIVETPLPRGTSQLLGTGVISLSASRFNHYLVLDIEDNAGLYQPTTSGGIWA
jgi:two-component system LytT family sensor kinase